MAPRKNKNKINNEVECIADANKRRRIEILNGTTGVPFTNPITQLPSIHLLHQQRNPPQTTTTTTVNTDLQLSYPPETNEDDVAVSAVDDIFSSLIPQQNFLIIFHINQMIKSVEEFWGRNFAEQVKKRKEMEATMKLKDEQADLFRKMCHYYEERKVLLEEMLQQSEGVEGCRTAAAAPEEEVKSSFVMFGVKRMDTACRKCRNRLATMLWMPCRHLCVCFVCERRVKVCPICGVEKTQSFMINYSP